MPSSSRAAIISSLVIGGTFVSVFFVLLDLYIVHMAIFERSGLRDCSRSPLGVLLGAEFIHQIIELVTQSLILGFEYLLIARQLSNLPSKPSDGRSIGPANLLMLIQ